MGNNLSTDIIKESSPMQLGLTLCIVLVKKWWEGVMWSLGINVSHGWFFEKA
jgi:hypothetical protein